MAKLERVKVESLRSQVYVQLKERLMEGEWGIGQKMPSENELCRSFGVSRVTVRAAIQQLEILGLVETKHGGGTYVRDFSTADLMDAFHPRMQIQRHQDIITILEYRKIVEKGTIALAVLRITTQDLEYLEETYATMKACTAEPEKHAKADHLFHYRLAQIAHNPIILKVYAIIDEIMSRAMVDIVKLLGCEIGLRYHRKLIDALKSGDASACEALMAAHIEETIQAVLRAKETVTARTEQEPASS